MDLEAARILVFAGNIVRDLRASPERAEAAL
jgi:hypothetical protein